MPPPPAPAPAAPPPFSPYDAAGDAVLDDEDEFDSEESDDDDVFAFLPPTTAEQLDGGFAAAQDAHHPQAQQNEQPGQPHAAPAAQDPPPGAAQGAAGAAAALQAQYFPTPYSPFAHSPFPPAAAALYSTSTQLSAPPPAAASTSTLASTSTSTGAPADPYAWRPVTARAPTADGRPHSAFDDAYAAQGGVAHPYQHPYQQHPTYQRQHTHQQQQQQQSFARPRTATPRARSPPRSPPSPSTDSQPGTAAGGGGDAYRLRRMTPAPAAPAFDPAIGAGDDRTPDARERHDDEGYAHQLADDDATLEHGDPPDSPGTRVADDEEGDEDGASETAGEEERGRRAGGKRRSGKGRSGYVGGGDVEAGYAFSGRGSGAVASGVQVHPRGAGDGVGVGRRMRNVNAQPYAAYAALANAHGYEARGTPRPTTRGTAPTSASASSPHRAARSASASSALGKGVIDDDASSVGAYAYDGDSVSGMSGVSGFESREGSIKMEFDFDAIEEEDSPFPEVRASVSNIDDPDMPAMTIRMWFVGLLLCMTSSAMNVFFNFRSPAPTIVPLALVLLSYPFGKFLAFSLPITMYRIPLPNLPRRWFPATQPAFAPWRLLVNILLPLTYPRALEFSLNPGPWNIKEHVLVFIMANVATGSPYALNAIVVSNKFYNIAIDYWFSLTLVLATQLTGFGLAGLCRRFLVWPASMVWPQNLVACTLLNTLHAEDDDDGIGMYGGTYEPGSKGMSRYKFYVITTAASFVFFFLPGYLFEALSVFSFICWAAPNNVPVNQLFGVSTGLGMSVITFDWTQISWIGSPLMVPWWAEVHVFFGFVLFFWIMTPILYYTNSWDLAYFPISANEPFDRFGNTYNVSRILMTNDTFDAAAYYSYSPLYLPATYAVTYLLAFALSTCVIVHTGLYHGKALINGLRKVRVEADDIHAKLMRNYPEVPDWWYLIAFGVFFALAVVTVEVWHTDVPVWALLLSVMLPVVYVLPSGFIYAMTGQGITINILAQIIPGTLLPGKPLVNMLFKAYSVQTLAAATSFVQDLKLGHYVKVPPRATFIVQMVSTVLAAFIQVGVKEWIFAHVPDICNANQKSQLTCPHNQVFFTASAVWGLIGPTKQFGTGSLYHPHLYAIVVGAVLPVPFFLWQRRYPNSWARYVSTPVIINGVSSIPPATGINYSSWFAVGFVFQYLIRKRNFAWWSKFNYVLSSALDSGTVIAVMVIFFTLQFPRGGSINVNWWGNQVFQATADFNRKPFLPIPPGGVTWTGFPPATDSAGQPLTTAPL